MIKEAIEKIIALSDHETIELDSDGRIYMKQGYSPVKEPMADPLSLHTLTGIKDFIAQNIDGKVYTSPTIIHISDYNSVDLITELIGDWKQRETILSSRSFDHANVNGRWKTVEDFIIMLHSEFVKNDGRDYLLQLTSSITDSASAKIKDNGITQSATVRSGISLVEEMEIKNPIILKPYRTFPEIDQPDIQFVFRIRKGGNGPECALFESDGGLWKIQTIQKIKAWFENELKDNERLRIIA